MMLDDILQAVRFGYFTNDDLNRVSEAVRYRRSQLTEQNRRSLRVGSKVQFYNSRTGQMIVGTVNKINRKYVMVGTGLQVWRVPGSMLEKV